MPFPKALKEPDAFPASGFLHTKGLFYIMVSVSRKGESP